MRIVCVCVLEVSESYLDSIAVVQDATVSVSAFGATQLVDLSFNIMAARMPIGGKKRSSPSPVP